MIIKDVEILDYDDGLYQRLVISLNGIKDNLRNEFNITEAAVNSGSVDRVVFDTAKAIAKRQYKCHHIVKVGYIERNMIEPVKNALDSYIVDPNIFKHGL